MRQREDTTGPYHAPYGCEVSLHEVPHDDENGHVQRRQHVEWPIEREQQAEHFCGPTLDHRHIVISKRQSMKPAKLTSMAARLRNANRSSSSRDSHTMNDKANVRLRLRYGMTDHPTTGIEFSQSHRGAGRTCEPAAHSLMAVYPTRNGRSELCTSDGTGPNGDSGTERVYRLHGSSERSSMG
jgi:hypothetical protein